MRFRRSLAAAVTLLCVVICIIGVGGTLSAQNNGNPSILTAVQAVQATLNSMVTTLNSIALATASGNTLFTPMVVQVGGDSLNCSGVNVVATNRSITVELFDSDTGALLASESDDVAPGRRVFAGAITSASNPVNHAFCKLTVTNGVKTDIRGAIALFAGAGSDKLVVAAQ